MTLDGKSWRRQEARMRVVLVGPRFVDYVFLPVEEALARAGHDVIRCDDAATFLADPAALADADVLYCMGNLRCDGELLARAPKLRAVVTPFIGLDAIDQAAATARGIVVANGRVPENYLSMAEATIMLMLVALYELHRKEDSFRRNLPRPQRQSARMLKGRTVGLIGMGRIARAVAERLLAWDVRLQACARRPDAAFPPHVARASLEELLRTSDVVSIHATYSPATRNLLDAEKLELMRPNAILINTARGGIIDEAALARIATAKPLKIVIDVFDEEPLPADSPLRRVPDAILTPHLAGHTGETAAAVPLAAIENISRALAGEPPLHVVNPEVLPLWRRRWS
jgi:phosphoglycerate dehydrogenase-like enzyme